MSSIYRANTHIFTNNSRGNVYVRAGNDENLVIKDDVYITGNLVVDGTSTGGGGGSITGVDITAGECGTTNTVNVSGNYIAIGASCTDELYLQANNTVYVSPYENSICVVGDANAQTVDVQANVIGIGNWKAGNDIVMGNVATNSIIISSNLIELNGIQTNINGDALIANTNAYVNIFSPDINIYPTDGGDISVGSASGITTIVGYVAGIQGETVAMSGATEARIESNTSNCYISVNNISKNIEMFSGATLTANATTAINLNGATVNIEGQAGVINTTAYVNIFSPDINIYPLSGGDVTVGCAGGVSTFYGDGVSIQGNNTTIIGDVRTLINDNVGRCYAEINNASQCVNIFSNDKTSILGTNATIFVQNTLTLSSNVQKVSTTSISGNTLTMLAQTAGSFSGGDTLTMSANNVSVNGAVATTIASNTQRCYLTVNNFNESITLNSNVIGVVSKSQVLMGDETNAYFLINNPSKEAYIFANTNATIDSNTIVIGNRADKTINIGNNTNTFTTIGNTSSNTTTVQGNTVSFCPTSGKLYFKGTHLFATTKRHMASNTGNATSFYPPPFSETDTGSTYDPDGIYTWDTTYGLKVSQAGYYLIEVRTVMTTYTQIQGTLAVDILDSASNGYTYLAGHTGIGDEVYTQNASMCCVLRVAPNQYLKTYWGSNTAKALIGGKDSYYSGDGVLGASYMIVYKLGTRY